MNKVYGVIFNDIDKKYYYLGDEEFAEGSLVIVNTERGMQLVKVVQVIDKISEEITDKIERLATEEEYEQYLENLKDAIEISTKNVGMKDHKTVLQEKLQINGEVNIKYVIINEQGPDHDKIFTAEVSCDNKKLAIGKGKTKKQAEMEAARIALENMH